jgi:phosphonate degradation associated HDIG domain protein
MHEHPTAAEVADLFQRRGHSEYGGEAVTQLEHALQAAMFAEKSKAPAALIVAALLHDIGHVLHDLPDDAPDDGVDDLHEELGHRWLASRFIPEVCEPVRLHVAAKRYLCSVDAKYMAALSEPSRVSLSLQGGPMTKEEADQFASGEHFQASLVLRRWDDAAKVVDLQTPPLEHFLNYIPTVSASLEQSAAS